MNQEQLKKELTKAKEILDKSMESENGELAKKLQIIYNFLLSLAEPERFNDVDKEALRRLAQELNYNENSSFEDWVNG